MESVENTIVSPITEEELEVLAMQVKVKLVAKFGRAHVDHIMRQYPQFFPAFVKETFLALRMYFHRKSKQ